MDIKIGSAPDSWGVWFPDDPRQTPWHRFLDEIVRGRLRVDRAGALRLPADGPAHAPRRARPARPEGVRRPSRWPTSKTRRPGRSWSARCWAAGELLAALGATFLVLIDDTYTDLFTGEPIGPARLDDDAWKRLIDTTHRVGRPGHRAVRADARLPPARRDPRRVRGPDRGLPRSDRPGAGRAVPRHGPPRLPRRRSRGASSASTTAHPLPAPEERRRGRSRSGRGGAHPVRARPWPWTCSANRRKGRWTSPPSATLLRDVNYDGWAIVEQDMYPAPFDKPLPIAQRTRAYLREIGIG